MARKRTLKENQAQRNWFIENQARRERKWRLPKSSQNKPMVRRSLKKARQSLGKTHNIVARKTKRYGWSIYFYKK